MATKKKKQPSVLVRTREHPARKKKTKRILGKEITWENLDIGRVYDLSNLPG